MLQNGDGVNNPASNRAATQFCISNWLGFLGSAKPEVLDTGILGNVRVRITLAPTNVLIMKEAFLAKGGIYEIPYQSYYSFTSAVSSSQGALKFSLASQSLNMVLATLHNGISASNAWNANTSNATYFNRNATGLSKYIVLLVWFSLTRRQHRNAGKSLEPLLPKRKNVKDLTISREIINPSTTKW